MERQSDLSLRQGDSIAHVHMDAVNKETVDQYLSEKARKARDRRESPKGGGKSLQSRNLRKQQKVPKRQELV